MIISDERLADLQSCIAEDIATEYPMLARDLIAALRELQEWRKPYSRAAAGQFPFEATAPPKL